MFYAKGCLPRRLTKEPDSSVLLSKLSSGERRFQHDDSKLKGNLTMLS